MAADNPRPIDRIASPAIPAGDLGRQTLELLLPSTCRVCDRCVPPGDDFCQACLAELTASERLMESCCPRCGRPGAGRDRSPTQSLAGEPTDAGSPGCQRCEREKLAFDRCVALWSYDGLVRNVVVAAKYGNQLPLAESLGIRLADHLADQLIGSPGEASSASPTGAMPELVTFVPSHLWRRIQRGNGGSRALAHAVANRLRSRGRRVVLADLLATTRRIKKQAWTGEKDRAANVLGGFQIRNPTLAKVGLLQHPRDLIGGKHILLVDDVMTTGATANENATMLKQAGARRVTVAVIARATSH